MSTCVAVAQELIRFQSTNPPGEEKACVDYLAKLLEGAGLSVETYEFAPGRSGGARESGSDRNIAGTASACGSRAST
jgi:succinyl-diaminopimelate desuccinylase